MQSRQVLTMRIDQVDGEDVAGGRLQSPAGWQATVHRVAAGQMLWLDVRAGQWLQVRAGALLLTQDAGFAALDARWAMTWPADCETPSGMPMRKGEFMRVSAAGRSAVQVVADAGEVLLVVWRPLSWRQRVMRSVSLSKHQSVPRRSSEAVAKVSSPSELQAGA